MQLNKTDANDAVGLAQIVRTRWYREVAVKREHGHRTRGLLGARAKPAGMRKEVANQHRGLLKVFGPRDRGGWWREVRRARARRWRYHADHHG